MVEVALFPKLSLPFAVQYGGFSTMRSFSAKLSPYYMKFSQPRFFRECREPNMTRKLNDILGKDQDRISLLRLTLLQTVCKSKRR